MLAIISLKLPLLARLLLLPSVFSFSTSVIVSGDPGLSWSVSTVVNSPDFLSTPTILQGRGLGGGLGFSSGDSVISVLVLEPEPELVSKAAARRPMMEEELCLIFSGAEQEPASTSSWVESEVSAVSGLKSEEGEVRLLARPVELKRRLVVRTEANTQTPG